MRGEQPIDNALQNAYMISLSGSFDKSVSGARENGLDKNGNPTPVWTDKFIYFFHIETNVYFTEFLPCPPKKSLSLLHLNAKA